MGVRSSQRVQNNVHPWKKEKEKKKKGGSYQRCEFGDFVLPAKLPFTQTHTCQRSLGVASAAKLCHVYVESGEQEGEARSSLVF